MSIVTPGAAAPAVDGVDLQQGTKVLFFYKVTCPVCQMAAPVAQRIHQAVPSGIVGVGQDPPERLGTFAREYGVAFDSIQDPPPYPASEAYGILTVPTLVLVDSGSVADVVESWDRDGWNRIVQGLADRHGQTFSPVSDPGDGLPSFRPG